MRVKKIDRGARALIARLTDTASRDSVLRVGVIGEGTYPDGTSVLDIANFQEFGTETIPSRSFIRAWYDENAEKNQRRVSAGVKRVVAGVMSWFDMWSTLGMACVGEIQQRISSNIPPPLSPKTIKRKGSSVALIDTGQLRQSITYQVDQ